MNSTIVQETVYWRGAPRQVKAVKIDDQTYVVSGNFLKTASIKNEWQEDVSDPEETVHALKAVPTRIDILKFWQRIPETEAKFNYYKEWREIAAIPISTFDH